MATVQSEARWGCKIKRFWSNVLIGPDCWEWQGATKQGGLSYGRVYFDGAKRKAHRVAYEMTSGTIPAGKVIAHKCDNPRCVKPAHLQAMTQAENIRDCVAKGRR